MGQASGDQLHGEVGNLRSRELVSRGISFICVFSEEGGM